MKNIELILTIIKFGAIGFATYVSFLSYRLINDRRQGWKWYLPTTLATALVFLYAEFRLHSEPTPISTELKIHRTPNRLPSDVPAVRIYRDKEQMNFNNPIELVSCESSPLLSVNAEELVEALREERRKSLTVGATACGERSADFAGIDFDGGNRGGQK